MTRVISLLSLASIILGLSLISLTLARDERLIYTNSNIYAVQNGPLHPTKFTLKRAYRVTRIATYHWNYAKGDTPGTIALRSETGKLYGPWRTRGKRGQGGVPNAYWEAYPNVILPPGTYTVIDSNPSTWSHNAESGYRGMVWVYGYPVSHVETYSGGSVSSGDGKLVWVETSGSPCDQVCASKGYRAVVAGRYKNGHKFYVCSANAHGEGFRPGYNLKPSWADGCVVGWGGREIKVRPYRCLCVR